VEIVARSPTISVNNIGPEGEGGGWRPEKIITVSKDQKERIKCRIDSGNSLQGKW
jgi:hypothetical protein